MMKKIVFLLVLILSISAFTIVNKANDIQVHFMKMEKMYVGVKNPIQVEWDKEKYGEIHVEGDDVEVEDGYQDGMFYIVPKKWGRDKIINILNSQGSLIREVSYKATSIPDPKASILGVHGGEISKNQLKQANFLKAEMENFMFKVK